MSAWSHSKFQASQGYTDPISRKFVFLIQHSGNQGRRSLWIYDQPGLHRLSQQNRTGVYAPQQREWHFMNTPFCHPVSEGQQVEDILAGAPWSVDG